MFEKTIEHLQKQIRNKLQLAGDITGVLTQFTKDESRKDADEYELAVAVLKSVPTYTKHKCDKCPNVAVVHLCGPCAIK